MRTVIAVTLMAFTLVISDDAFARRLDRPNSGFCPSNMCNGPASHNVSNCKPCGQGGNYSKPKATLTSSSVVVKAGVVSISVADAGV